MHLNFFKVQSTRQRKKLFKWSFGRSHARYFFVDRIWLHLMAGSYLKWRQDMEDIMVACIFFPPPESCFFFSPFHTVATAVLHAKEVSRQPFHMSLSGTCKSSARKLV